MSFKNRQMKQYLVLSLMLIFITGCSLEIGNEYQDKRMPVGNKSYLSKQKKERFASQRILDKALSNKKRYKFVDSEYPYENKRKAMYEKGYTDCTTERCPCVDNRCENRYYGSGRSDYQEDEQIYYDNEHKNTDFTEHQPEGGYSVKRKENTIKIKPTPESKIPAREAIYTNKVSKSTPVSQQIHPSMNQPSTHTDNKVSSTEEDAKVQPVTSTSQSVVSKKIEHPDNEERSSDDEAVPTIPPKIITHDNMPTIPTSSDDTTTPMHTVKEANENIANIRAEIEAKNELEKQKIQLQASQGYSSSSDNEDMKAKLQHLKELTSQGQELQRFTPKFPSEDIQKKNNSYPAQKKISSQEVHLALNSDEDEGTSSGNEPARSDLPPPADLSQ